MDNGTPTIRFAAGSQHVSIAVQGPYASLPDERRAIVTARSGAFHGEVALTIWTYELQALHRILVDLDRRVGQPARAEWHVVEGEVALTFELSQRGHLRVDVELRDGWDAETTLRFPIDADQSYLPLWTRQVAAALEGAP